MPFLKKITGWLLLLSLLFAAVPLALAGTMRSNSLGQNLWTQSERFSSVTPWSTVATTVTENYAQAPDGTFTADRIQFDAGTSYIYSNSFIANIPVGQSYTQSVWMRATTSTATVQIWAEGGGSTNSGPLSLDTTWRRYSFTIPRHAAGGGGGIVNVFPGAGADFLAWGYQLNYGLKPSAYNPTVASAKNSTFTPTGSVQSNQLGQNLITSDSERFNASSWSKTNSTVSADSMRAPDGTMTADTLTGDATAGQHRVYHAANGLMTTGPITYSVSVKAGTLSWVILELNDSGASYAWFNVSTGALGNKAAGMSTTITPQGDGWYRVSATLNNAYGASVNFSIGQASANGVFSYAGTTGDTLYLWGAQVVNGSKPGAYNPTVASARNTAYVPAGSVKSSQLGQNLFTNSQALSTWIETALTTVDNSASSTAPDGTKTASSMTETTANNVHVTNLASGISAAGQKTWTYSVYVKDGTRRYVVVRVGTLVGYEATFDLTSATVVNSTSNVSAPTITPVGDGWYRLSITFTTNEAANITAQIALSDTTGAYHLYVGSTDKYIMAWGAQLVSGSKPGAYNPTTSAAINSNYVP